MPGLQWVSGVPVVGLLACVTAGQPPMAGPETPALSKLTALEDARSLGGGFVEAQMDSPDAALRQRALRALARLQRVETVPSLLKGLRDPAHPVREEAAFALGQLGLSWNTLPADASHRVEAALLEALHSEADVSVRVALIEALGKVGGAEAFPALRTALDSPNAAERATAGIAAGLIVYKSKGKTWDASLEASLAAAARDADAEVRFGAVYAAMRACRADAPARPALVDILRGHLADTDTDVRANAARGLGEVAVDADLASLANTVADPVARVGAEAARALAKTAGRCKAEPCASASVLSQALGGSKPLAALTRIAALSDPVAGTAMEAAARRINANAQAVTPGTTDDKLVAAFAAMRADAIGGTLALLPQGLHDAAINRVVRRLVAQTVIDAKGKLSNDLKWALDFSSAPEAATRSLAPEMLAAHDTPETRLALQRLVADPDSIVAASAAEQAAKLKDNSVCSAIGGLLGRIAPEDVEAQQTAIGAAADLKCPDLHLETFLASPNFSVRLAAATALEGLTGTRPPIPEVAEKPGAVLAMDLPARPRLALTTRRGVIHLELFADDAPGTAKSFVALTRRKFFNGLTFHRVVPDFVIQGGDPRGDGSGGPGYTLRCEINRHPYVPGALGMALSGKDTGGSQFFITNSRQPHLDGKYTVFGRVVSGQEIVDSVLEGDEIVRVEEER